MMKMIALTRPYVIGGSIGAFSVFLLIIQLQPGGLDIRTIWVNDDEENGGLMAADTTTSTLSTTTKDPCAIREKWPDLELFLTTPVGEKEYFDWFLPPLALFWPRTAPLKMAIVTDADKPLSLNFSEQAIAAATRLIPEIQVRSVLTKRVFESGGWDKSQWLKLWADNFTDAEYVGFVDTDSVFVTRVTLEDLFIDGKPVVRPIYGRPREGWYGMWHLVPERTFEFTGYKDPFNCMTFFPVIVKTAHIKAVRQRILSQMKRGWFDDAFVTFLKRQYYSEYGMMCTIMWWEFRDDYYWIISETEEGWNGTAPPGQVANTKEAGIPDEWLRRTRPHLTTHWTYTPTVNQPNALRNAMRKGYCYSLTDKESHPDYCSAYNRTVAVNELEFMFEFDNFSKRSLALGAHLARIQNNEQCPHPWRINRVKELA